MAEHPRHAGGAGREDGGERQDARRQSPCTAAQGAATQGFAGTASTPQRAKWMESLFEVRWRGAGARIRSTNPPESRAPSVSELVPRESAKRLSLVCKRGLTVATSDRSRRVSDDSIEHF